jgi:hypothetical protein
VLAHLIRKEILDQLLSLRFLLLAATGAVIIWLSLYDGYAFYQESLTDFRHAQARTQSRLQQLAVADNWAEISGRGFAINREPGVLTIFVRGLEPVLGRTITTMGGVRSKRLRESSSSVEPILGVFPPLDLALVVQVVLSLFILLFTYDAISGEKEAGTLRLSASFSVPRHQFLLSKMIGALLPTLAAFGIPLLLGLGVILAMPDVHLRGEELSRLGMILITFALYLTAFTAVGMMASCLVYKSSTSFVILLAFWTATVAVIPRLSLIAADGARPAGSLHELETRKHAVSSGALRERYIQSNKWTEDYIARMGHHPRSTPEGREAWILEFARTRVEARKKFHPEQDRLDEEFKNRYTSRLDLAVTLARISPAFALSNASTRLAGTGIEPYTRYRDSFARHLRKYALWAGETKNKYQLSGSNPDKYGEQKWDVSSMPRFDFRATLVDEDLHLGLVDMGILAFWCLFFFVIAYVALLRYDLR